jgi:hypothetical protein
MAIIETTTDTITIEKKIVRLLIDVETRGINFTVRTLRTASDGAEISREYHDYAVSGPAFEALAARMPDPSLPLYDNLAMVSYAYLQGEGVV